MQYSVVRYNEILNNYDARIDAEYHHPETIRKLKLVDQRGSKNLCDIVDFVVGPFGSTVTVDKYVNSSEYRYIRNKDIESFFIKDHEPSLIPQNVYTPLKQFHIKKEDLLLTVVGTLGKVAIAREKDTKSIFSCKSTLIRSKGINPYYLLSYLNSEIGQIFVLRGKRGAIQEGLNLSDLKEIKVFTASKIFQELIEKIVKKSFYFSEQSNLLYKQADNLLLEELGLKDWKPKHQLSYVKNYSDTQKAERFDAEYFQPQYDAIIEKIKSYNQKQAIKKEVILDDVVKWSKGVEVGSEQYLDEGFDFIRISDFSPKGISITSKKISSELFAELKGKYSPRKGDILFTKDGTIGLTYLVDQNQDSIASGAFLKLRPKIDIEAEYLALVLNSVICKKQIEMMSGGAIIAHLKPSDAMNLQIPILKPDKQKEISLKIVDSKEKDRQSKSLLEIAKKAVEIAIESNEEKANKWIDQELEKLGVRLSSD